MLPVPPSPRRKPEPTRVNSPYDASTCCSTSRCASCGWCTISEIGQIAAQRARPGEGGRQRAERVAQREAGASRAFVLMPGDRHDAGHRLQFAVEGGGAALRPVLAEAGHRAIDQARVDLAQRLIAEPEA